MRRGQAMLLAQFVFPDNFGALAVSSAVFGLIGIILLLLGYKVFDWLTPSLHFQEELKKGNVAVAIVVSVLLAAIAYVAGNVVR
jgi:putative membrane protein